MYLISSLTAGIECNNRKEQKKPKLAFYDFARLDCLGSNPHSLDLTTRQLDSNPLQVGLESSLVDFDELQANAAGFFTDALVYDTASDSGPFSCDCAKF